VLGVVGFAVLALIVVGGFAVLLLAGCEGERPEPSPIRHRPSG
jgi:hypothetical protein